LVKAKSKPMVKRKLSTGNKTKGSTASNSPGITRKVISNFSGTCDPFSQKPIQDGYTFHESVFMDDYEAAQADELDEKNV